jgi:hypothetical protein
VIKTRKNETGEIYSTHGVNETRRGWEHIVRIDLKGIRGRLRTELIRLTVRTNAGIV